MRILVVEDEDQIASFLLRGLQEEGYVVDRAVDGEQGIRCAFSTQYDVIVLDLLLPRRFGLDVVRELRSSGNPVPILVLTAQDTVEGKVEGLDAGADDYLTKPFAFDELLARIRSLLRRGTSSSPITLKVGELTLDLAKRRLKRAGRTIELSAREFSLLEYFMRNPSVVLSRTRIHQHVWACAYNGLSNVVDVYVRYLRRKLEASGEPRIIHTVRGHGYVLRSAEVDR
jgi:DNA-binding response OmpR family regulator